MQRFFRALSDRKHDPPVLWAFIFLLFLWSAACGPASAASMPVGNDAAARLSGTVLDDGSGAPVAGATIRLVRTGFVAVTDDDGSFVFRLVPPGEYVIDVSSVGYESFERISVRLSADQSLQVEVYLTPTVYELGSVRVTDSRLLLSGDRPVVIGRQAIQRSGSRSLAEVLQQVEGVYVQQAGPSGPVEVRMRGSTANQVLVLLDGQKLNGSGNGVADLSSIPVDVVERIEIHTGGASAEFGPDALGGAINIVTRPQSEERDRSFEVSSRTEAYGGRDVGMQVTDPLDWQGLKSRFAYSHRENEGDFDYAYAVSGSGGSHSSYDGTRRNNDVRMDNYFGSGAASPGGDVSLSFSLHRYRAHRGLPGSVSRPDTSGRSLDDRLVGSVALAIGGTAEDRHEMSIGYTQLDQSFVNIDSAISPAYHYNSRFLNDIFTARHTSQRSFWSGNRSRVVVEYRRERLFHDDFLRPQFAMGKSTRAGRSAAVMLSQRLAIPDGLPVDVVVVDGALRYDRTRTDSEYETLLDHGDSHTTESWSPRVGLALSGGGAARYTIRGSYGKSLRLPSINALFWRGDARSTGNPDLRPERSEHSEVSAEVSFGRWFFEITGGATYFHSQVRDLVVWNVNFQDQWQPSNLGLARITGHEESIKIGLFERRLVLDWRNAVTDGFNKVPEHATYNKRLVFYPRYTSRLAAQLQVGGLSLSYAVRWADKTYTNAANTKYYGAYRVDDLSLGVEIAPGRQWLIRSTFDVKNIRDEQYVLLANYPMPGRSIGVGIELTFTPDSRGSTSGITQ